MDRRRSTNLASTKPLSLAHGPDVDTPTKNRALDVVTSYIKALDSQHYDRALDHLHERVRIRGPAGETFGRPLDFIEMLRKWQGRYDVKKAFADGDDVCVLYDLKTVGPTVFMCSWYQVKDAKIVSIQTVFDPRAFGPPPGQAATQG